MQQVIGTASSPHTSVIYDPAIQTIRRMQAELLKIGEYLSQSPLQDELTENIRLWQAQFMESLQLRRVAPIQVHDQFLNFLEELLVNPITNEPLDDRSWLGSDGRVYGDMFLRVHQSRVAPEFRERSPLFPQDNRQFTKQAHTVVRRLIPWLRSYRQGFFPTPNCRRIAQLIAQRDLLEQTRDATRVYLENVTDLVTQTVENVFIPYQERQIEIARQDHQRLDTIERQDQLNELRLNSMIDTLTREVQVLESIYQANAEELRRIHDDIEGIKRDNLQLEQNIHATRIAIKKQKKQWLKDLAKAVAIVGVNAIGTWGLQILVSNVSQSSAVALIPKGNGAQLRIISTF